MVYCGLNPTASYVGPIYSPPVETLLWAQVEERLALSLLCSLIWNLYVVLFLLMKTWGNMGDSNSLVSITGIFSLLDIPYVFQYILDNILSWIRHCTIEVGATPICGSQKFAPRTCNTDKHKGYFNKRSLIEYT